MNHRDKTICEKIAGYCEEISSTHKSFDNNKNLFFDDNDGFIYRNAVAMPILQIGELAKSFSNEFVSDCKEIPWRQIRGMRDILAHQYGKLDKEMLWNTSHEDITELRYSLSHLLG